MSKCKKSAHTHTHTHTHLLQIQRRQQFGALAALVVRQALAVRFEPPRLPLAVAAQFLQVSGNERAARRGLQIVVVVVAVVCRAAPFSFRVFQKAAKAAAVAWVVVTVAVAIVVVVRAVQQDVFLLVHQSFRRVGGGRGSRVVIVCAPVRSEIHCIDNSIVIVVDHCRSHSWSRSSRWSWLIRVGDTCTTW